jgi:hypothetical protein
MLRLLFAPYSHAFMPATREKIVSWKHLQESDTITSNELGITFRVPHIGIVYAPMPSVKRAESYNNDCACLIVTFEDKSQKECTWIIARIDQL